MEFSKQTTLEKSTVTIGRGTRDYSLVHATAGLEIAGSGTRETKEKWGVIFVMDNAVNGRWFKTEGEARAMFHSWTHPE